MIFSILIGAAIFGYAGYSGYRWYQKQKQGKCAACEVSDTCVQKQPGE
jgi:predicted negative regulator of RcsB-dependent stress response